VTITLERLSSFLDGEATADEQRLIGGHFAGCRACQAAVAVWRRAGQAAATSPPRTAGRSRRAVLAITGIILLLIVGSGAAIAAGWFSEVFRIGPLSAAASRSVSLQEARAATQLPLPRSDQLPGGWGIHQVELTMTPEWRSVDVQYARTGSRPMGVTVYSPSITVNPGGALSEVVTVAGVSVEMRYGESATARFIHRGATVIIRAFQPEVDAAALRALVAAWIATAE
jgi:hypothetical protein